MEVVRKIRQLIAETNTEGEVIIYGAGWAEINVFRFLKNNGVLVDAFVVTA